MESVTKIPSPGESDHGVALDDEQLRKLVQGFKGRTLFGIVSVAAFTGARRNEILALRWSDLNAEKKTLRIERAIEETKAHGVRFKGPRRRATSAPLRSTMTCSPLLLSEREKYLRLRRWHTGRRLGRPVVVKLPDGALMFPNADLGRVTFVTPPGPRDVTKEFERKARKLGFKSCVFTTSAARMKRFCLTAACPYTSSRLAVAMIRRLCSELRQAHQKADTNAAAVIGNIAKGILGN